MMGRRRRRPVTVACRVGRVSCEVVMHEATTITVGPAISRLMRKVGAEMVGTFALLFVKLNAP